MFDDPTTELIRSAPELNGLDPNSLPMALTKAYAEIVAVRLRFRKMAGETSNAADLLEPLRPELERLRKIAFTQEAIASVSPEGPQRRGAAFLAATAHYVTLQAQLLVSPSSTTFKSLTGMPEGMRTTYFADFQSLRKLQISTARLRRCCRGRSLPIN